MYTRYIHTYMYVCMCTHVCMYVPHMYVMCVPPAHVVRWRWTTATAEFRIMCVLHVVQVVPLYRYLDLSCKLLTQKSFMIYMKEKTHAGEFEVADQY